MRCELEEKDVGLFPGKTLFTKRATHCARLACNLAVHRWPPQR
jgi:hypothetical protein